jgi:L-lactate dehydrogenase complex protein LldG
MTEPGENRETFFKRIRAALDRAPDAPLAEAPPAIDPALVRLDTADDELLDRFAQKAEAVGLNVHRLSLAEAGDRIEELIGRFEAKSAIVGQGPALVEHIDVAAVLREGSVKSIDWATDHDAAFDADVGITDAHAALAETGTLIGVSDAEHGRSLSLLPPRVIVLLRARDVLADMLDYWARFESPADHRELPSSQVFITGPSKTADIEGELVTGVHGPGEMHVLLLDDG